MASMGSINTNSYKDRYYIFSWQTTSQSIENNTSTISWSVVAAGTSSSSYRGEKEFTIQINGTEVFKKTTKVYRYGDEQVASGVMDIPHNADGTKTFAVYVGAAVYAYGAYNVSASTTFTLDAIVRRATITSAPAFNDTDNPTITYSNPMGNSVSSLKVCISADGYNPTIPYRDVSKTGSSYTFDLTDSERLSLQSAFPNDKGGFVFFYIQTVLNGTTYVNRMAKWMTIVDAPPAILSCAVKDTNSTVVAATGNEQNCIPGYSNITYALNALPQKGAEITEVKAVCGSQTLYNFNNTFEASTTGTITFYIKDSRGLTTQYTDSTMNTIAYVKPTFTKFDVSIALDGDVSTVATEGTYFVGSLGKQVNGCSAYCRYKEGNGAYTDWIPLWTTQNSGKFIASEDIPLDYTKAYTFQLRATDRITTIYSEEKIVKALPVFDWGENSFNFNVPVSIEGSPVADFIIEERKSGEWMVRKWKSGLAEAWTCEAAREYDISTPVEPHKVIYRSDAFEEVFDIGGVFFTRVDNVQLSIEDWGYGSMIWGVMNDSVWCDADRGAVYIYYQALCPYETWIEGLLHIHIRGRWD